MDQAANMLRGVLLAATLLVSLLVAIPAQAAGGFEVYVSNERSGDITVIDGASFQVIATIPVGKRPRGIHASPDGKTVYVALSGTPIEGPPQLDANGNPVFKRDQAMTMTRSRPTSRRTASAWWRSPPAG